MGQGGADRVTSILLQQLDRNKYDLILLLMKPEGEHLKDIPTDVQVRSSTASSLWFFLPFLVRIIRSHQPDVVFSMDGGTNVPLSIYAFLTPFRKWKSIVSERSVLFPVGKNILKRCFLVLGKFLFYRFNNSITAVSDGVRKDIHKWLLIPPSRVQVVYSPLIDEKILLQASEEVLHSWFKLPREIPVIVHAGRFVAQKDHLTLLRAFKLLIQQVEARLFLLGEGELRKAMEEYVRAEGLEDNVFFAGFDINPYKYFSKCDAFVLSSVTEGMPGALIQAMACGAACISTNCEYGPSEIINRSGTNGILVPPKNEQELELAMRQVLTDTGLATKLRANGNLAVDKFKVDAALNTYVLAIES